MKAGLSLHKSSVSFKEYFYYLDNRMKAKTPVTFDFEGRVYHATLVEKMVAGSNVFYLMIKNYNHGKLSYTNNQWQLPNSKFSSLAEFFGDFITASNQ